MEHDPKQIASDWIAYARFGPDEAPEPVFADGWILNDLVEDEPSTAWNIIQIVVRQYPLSDYYSVQATEAQKVIGLTAAGPLEDLLSTRGHDFIDLIEKEAERDQRMAWALGGVWQSTTPLDVWARVQSAADYTFWERRSPSDR